ncbi:MAG: phosphoglycerate kinase [Gammaproteobacteria bacterium]|nr:phosphoglycerate kinase [Gammaproteobacteria bacterium]
MLKSIKNVDIENKTVLLRLDLNVPIQDGKIQSDFRIIKSVPTILHLLKNNNSIIILSHLGRPNEGKIMPSLSLKKISQHLSKKLGHEIEFIENWIDGIKIEKNRIIMCENVRFQKGERANDKILSKKIASLGDIFVFDAFGVSHRKEASTYGVLDYIDSYIGLLVEDEINNANSILNSPQKPLLTIISGAKISTKIKMIHKLIEKSDFMILGGGVLNTFLNVLGYEIGQSLAEKEFVNEVKEIISGTHFHKIILPIDLVCSELDNPDQIKNRSVSMVQSNESIFDIGTQTINKYRTIIESSKTIFWNGPLGYIEKTPFDNGTVEILKMIASADNYSIIGGGDTVPIVEGLGLQNNITCLSTGGGSLLKYIEGESLPVLSKLGVVS